MHLRHLLYLLPACLLLAGLLPMGAEGERPRARLGPVLKGVLEERGRGGLRAARERAQRHRLKVRGSGRVSVLLQPRSRTSSAIERRLLRRLGARVTGSSRSYLRVWAHVDQLERLAGHPDIAEIRAPDHAIPLGYGTTVSEGVALTGADLVQASSFTGAGVSMAVIDIDFLDLAATQALGELPGTLTEVDLTGQGMEGGNDHGTAVAETALDMAPGVDLHLIRVDDSLDFENAVDYVNNGAIDVVNLSLAFPNTSYYDDTGTINDALNNSRDTQGVFWAVAAGNFARRHWRGVWDDPDADGELDYLPGLERLNLSGGPADVCLYLNWNQYPSSQTNLDLYVYRFDTNLTASSTASNGGGGRPSEEVCFPYLPFHAPYGIEVRHVSGPTAGLDVSLFSAVHDFDLFWVSEASFMDPAAAHGAFSVGAISRFNWLNPFPLAEAFSSRGPTFDGRIKPDIVGPDGTTVSSRSGTFGTSFATPHVAGAAALLWEQDPTLTVAELEAALRKDAIDQGAPATDPIYGAGQLVADLLPPDTTDSDGDGFRDVLDNCEHLANPSQSDIGHVGGVGADGVGDVCQCGDVDSDGVGNANDVANLRELFAGNLGGLAAPEKCNVRGPQDGGVSDCDLVDLVVLRRAVPQQLPSAQQVCQPAEPPLP